MGNFFCFIFALSITLKFKIMTKSEKNSVEIIDKAIASLYATRETILAGLSLTEKVKKDNWVIDETSGNPVYFKFIKYDGANNVTLERNGSTREIWVNTFNTDFRLANKAEIEQHERFLYGKKQLVEKPISKSEKWTQLVNDICDLSNGELTMILNHVEVKKGSDFNSYFLTQIDKLKKMNNVKKITSVPAYDSKGSITPNLDLPDFYMVTVRGLNGTKKRHETYAAAEKEAIRLAKQENHRAHIMGIVAVVDPVSEVKVTRK